MLDLQKDHFAQKLPADKESQVFPRKVKDAAYSYVTPQIPSNPTLIHASDELAEQLGIAANDLEVADMIDMLSGKLVAPGATPYASVYSGHQFGQWAGQLGDGRAINLGGIVDRAGQEQVLQLKGAGPTPYSRTADGFAVLRSSIREHLCSEAMYHLGVPTTRSLSLIATGDEVMRDIMYDGHPAYEPRAVVCRVAPSFVRFGHFQHFAAHKQIDILRALADHIIDDYTDIQATGKDRYLALFDWVTDRTIDMIVHWQRVGFVHGVMNTDNLSILGLTIDYGPYGWLDNYDTEWTPNTTDRHGKRYRYGHQPRVAAWNLMQLANALYLLIEETEPLEAILKDYGQRYSARYLRMMHDKLGLQNMTDDTIELIKGMDQQLQEVETDMTMFYRLLGDKNVATLPAKAVMKYVSDAWYEDELTTPIHHSWLSWIGMYQQLCQADALSPEQRAALMSQTNPRYVLRNYMAQLAIDNATEGDYSLIDELYQMLKQPYTDQSQYDRWFDRRPDWARDKVGCSMLSCSS